MTPNSFGRLTRGKVAPPVPKFILYQIGDALIPRTDFETQLNYQSRDITDVLHGADGEYDYFRCGRSPLERGALHHTGRYLDDCLRNVLCGQAVHEWTKLRRVTGTYQPFIFYYSDPESYCPPTTAPECGCPVLPHCGKWLWAWGKVISVTNDASIDDWTAPAVSTIEIEGKLESPLREVHPSIFRYGKQLIKPIGPCVTLEDAEQLIARDRDCYFAPCDLPDSCCETDRWWLREAIECRYPGDCRFNSNLWSMCDVYKFIAGANGATGCFVINVPGTYRPEVRWIIEPQSYITIDNFLGSKTYYIPQESYFCTSVYIDSESGEVKTRTAGSIVDVDIVCDIPRLEVGENRITFTRTATLGVVPTWIN